MIKGEMLAQLLQDGAEKIDSPDETVGPGNDPLVVVPSPDLDKLRRSGAASLDLRLGTWFVTLRQSRLPYLQAGDKLHKDELSGGQLTKYHYVPFGEIYWLHPQSFVLGVTLEWIRMPSQYGGYVTSRSSWGRRGLVIATATGVHPGFRGCLTLELSNVGEIPIPLRPGMALCQLFLHQATVLDDSVASGSMFAGTRRPRLGDINPDDFFKAVSNAYKMEISE